MKKITNYILSVLLSGSLLSASLFYTAQTTSAASDKTTKEKQKSPLWQAEPETMRM